MRRRGRGVLHGAVAVLGVGLLSACTGGADPVATPTSATSAPSPTVAASPTPTPMAFPTPAPEFAEPTPEGAIAAGTHFIALYDYAFSTGDSGPLMAMSAEGCEYCTYVRDQVQMMLDGGYSSIREPMRVVASDGAEIREDEWFRAHLRIEQGPLATVMPDGTSHQTSDGGTVDFIFAMSWQVGGWRVMAVDLEEIPS